MAENLAEADAKSKEPGSQEVSSYSGLLSSHTLLIELAPSEPGSWTLDYLD